ncbi:MAG: hydrogenase iron-sulfur subunit [Candidatus Ranarchaeia archaeon]
MSSKSKKPKPRKKSPKTRRTSTKKKAPIKTSQPKIGVFICECGGNISDVVDVEKVASSLKGEKQVGRSTTTQYLCAQTGIDLIKKAIKNQKTDRIVLACCTPKMHRKKFEAALREEGINPALLEIVNVREQDSWVHPDDPDGATQKAIDLTKGATRRITHSTPLELKPAEVIPEALVIGAGIAGITAALRIAESGTPVHLIEKKPSIGGHMIQYPKVFPTLDCSQCILTPKMGDAWDDPNIHLHTLTEIKSVTGNPGNYTVTLQQQPRGVSIEDCINCGLCARVCPVDTPNDHNEYMNTRKAAYIPFAQATPPVYVIDFDACTKCGACVEKCPRDAIDLDEPVKEFTVKVGAIVVATGFDLYDMNQLGEYHYGRHPNIVTALQMERMLDITGPTKSLVQRPSDKETVKRVTFVLCSGSRIQNDEKGVTYCSSVCCLYALKQATLLRKRGVDVWIHYIDIRTPGPRYEDFYLHTQELGAHFVKGKISELTPDGDQVIIRAQDMTLNEILEYPTDLVVLCPPVIPNASSGPLAETLKTPLTEHKFLLENHPKLDPLATKKEGIFAAGMVTSPKDIQTTVAEAEGTAVKTLNFINSERMQNPEIAYLRFPQRCTKTGACELICPPHAITLAPKPKIDPLTCTGCAACIPACPENALDLHGFTDEQLTAQILGILEDTSISPKILVFATQDTVYTAADIAGINRIPYPSNIRIIPVPTTNRVTFKHLLLAFEHGADGVMFLEAPAGEGSHGKAHETAEENARKYQDQLEDHDIESTRLWFSRVYVPDWQKLTTIFDTFTEMIEDL